MPTSSNAKWWNDWYISNLTQIFQKIGYPTNHTQNLLQHLYVWVHSEYINKTNTYPRNVRLTFLLPKCQFIQAKLFRSCWLFLAKVSVLLQCFSCQHSLASFIQAKFYMRRTEDEFKYAKPVYLSHWWIHLRASLVSLIDCDYSKTCNRLRLPHVWKGQT